MTSEREDAYRETGPLADEAAQFAAAAIGWAQRLAGSVDAGSIATGAPECTGCPVCRTISALRDPGPDLADRVTRTVTDLATAVAAGLRHAFDGHHAPAPEGRDGQTSRGGQASPGGDPGKEGHSAPGVQRIDIA